ncbi:MAG: hypothetical protein QNJ81_06605 [Acidimicrobiia bacterium]|nr:hypothetical protein [Acidimicrobiia bacterium]
MRKSRAATVVIVFQLVLALGLPAQAQESPRSSADCSLSSTGSVPIPDLGGDTYQGEAGGLYPDGSNDLPADHASLGLWHAAQIEPLDGAGDPDPSGSIVLLSIGVSNTRSEYGMFARRARDVVDSDVMLINGAQPGEDISQWQSADSRAWQAIDGALGQNGVTAEQVQAVWIKLPDIVNGPAEILPFPTNSLTYRDQLAVVVQHARDAYPNLRLAYLSSRIYAGYNTSGRPSPEPLAYENGFGVKWLIADQIAGDASLNADPRRGEVEAPWLAWGPYLWADGTNPRSDGLIWECGDLQDDGIHPSQSGAVKVADMLVAHFTTHPTAAPWFASDGTPIGEVVLPPPADVPVTTMPPETTTTTTTQPPVSTTTTTVAAGAETARPGPPDRTQREEERLARQEDNSSANSNEGVLIATAIGLLVLLGAGAMVSRYRREQEEQDEAIEAGG